MGTENVATVPFAMTWSFWWQADRISLGLVDFWQAPIFAPTPDAFALSETNTLGGFLMAPLVLLSGSAALGHNLFLILALALNGLSASRLLQAWRLHRLVAVCAGVAMLMLPLPHQEVGVLPLVSVFGILWSFHALTLWLAEPGGRRAVPLALSLAATYFLCFQYALFLAIVLVALGGILLRRRHLAPRAVASLALAGVLAGGLVAPVVYAQLHSVTEEAGFERKLKKVGRLAAKPRHFVRTPWKQAIPTPGIAVSKKPGWKAFFPGTGRVVLAILGLAWALALPRTARWGWFLGSGSLLAYAMALGPNLEIVGVNIWELAAHLPGYSKVRSVNRWAVFVQIFVVLLSGFGLQWVLSHFLGRTPEGSDAGLPPARGRSRLIWGATFLVMSGLCMAEILPPRQQLKSVPERSQHEGWGDWVQANTATDAVLAFLPFSEGGNVKDYEEDAARMLLGPVHRRAMANGYSSFFPRPFRELKKKLVDFPTQEGVDALREAGVTHLVLDEGVYPEHLITDYPPVAAGMIMVYRDERAGVTLYAVRPERSGGS